MVLACQEWRHYIEGCRKVTCITDHATLKHLTDTKNLTALSARRCALWHDILSPLMGKNDKGEDAFEILYRKGELNDSDALSRRPDLHHAVCKYEDLVQEADLETANEFFSSMCHLQIDPQLLAKVQIAYQQDPTYSGNTMPRGVTYDTNDELYYMADKLCIPNDMSIKNMLMQEYHDTQGHLSHESTLRRIQKMFWWPRMAKEVKQYCRKCPTCERIKARTTKPYGKLSPLPKPTRPWDTISMDFITGLPLVDGYDAIATFVDTYTKQAHFIPCTIKIDAPQFARLYFSNIFRLHGLSRCIISDRDPRFTSTFWKELMKHLRTKLNMSTAYHPQTDGQTERTHRTIEQILRGFIHAQHDDWLHALPLAEFCYNNNVHSSTGFSPFEAIHGYNPLTPPDLISAPNSQASNQVQRIHDIHELISEQLKIADEYMKHDTKNRANSSADFKENQMVWLSTENLVLRNQPSKKFKQRFIGPYKIINKISSAAYELLLPESMACHNVFHISKLRPCNSSDAVPDLIPTATEPTREEYVVDSIVDHAIAQQSDGFYSRGPALVFKVRWAGYGPSADTWETYANLRRVHAFLLYIRRNVEFQRLLQTKRYHDCHRGYPSRFPLDFN